MIDSKGLMSVENRLTFALYKDRISLQSNSRLKLIENLTRLNKVRIKMNQIQKRTIRNMLKKMSVEDIVKKTRFNRHQVSAAQFIYFSYSFGEVVLFRNKDEFSLIQDSGFKACLPIEELASIPQLEINKYWAVKNGVHVLYRLGDYLPDIYRDLTNNETV